MQRYELKVLVLSLTPSVDLKKESLQFLFFKTRVSNPDSNFSLQQSCSNLAQQNYKLAASLIRLECKLETSYCKRVSHHKSNLLQACCVKVITNYSKNKVRRQTSNSKEILQTLTTEPTSHAILAKLLSKLQITYMQINHFTRAISKDWYELNKKKYVFGSKDYTKAKQALTASLKKSDYVEKVPNSPKKLMYRILEEGKNKENKRLKKEFRKEEVETEVPYNDHTLPSVESGYGSALDSPPSGNCVEPSKGSFTTSSNNGLSQLPCVEANSLFQKHDIQQYIYSSPCTLDGFVMSEAMDDSVSVENSVAVLDVTTSVEDCLANIQPFTDNLRSTDFFNENPEYPTPGLSLMECSSENPESSSSGLIENGPAENEVINRCIFLQFTNISDEELNNFIIKNIPALNSNPPMTNYENLNNHASEMQNMHGQHTEYQDLITKELRNKPMENISNINSRPSVYFEENISEQNFSSQGKIKTGFEETVSKETNGFKTIKDYKFTNDHLAIFLKPNIE
ncbi:hypothetical protein AVEN_192525-1 [Araneus ventricosus]|uniref:Uncharacterized protein n=1 Tax=Araneus ventricosus TaxID=182803 RepID=A0A4Y2NUM1_ARAVE|nr:hypothetical protein AVEN_192525-1 [Araneus ventricosus]